MVVSFLEELGLEHAKDRKRPNVRDRIEATSVWKTAELPPFERENSKMSFDAMHTRMQHWVSGCASLRNGLELIALPTALTESRTRSLPSGRSSRVLDRGERHCNSRALQRRAVDTNKPYQLQFINPFLRSLLMGVQFSQAIQSGCNLPTSTTCASCSFTRSFRFICWTSRNDDITNDTFFRSSRSVPVVKRCRSTSSTTWHSWQARG